MADLRAALMDTNALVQLEAAITLRKFGHDRDQFGPLLHAALESGDDWVRQTTVLSLPRLGAEAASLLANLLDRPPWDNRLREVLCQALQNLGAGPDNVRAVAGGHAACPQRMVLARRQAALALSEMAFCALSALPALEAAADDPDPAVRHAVAFTRTTLDANYRPPAACCWRL